jgi:hypothetical protein
MPLAGEVTTWQEPADGSTPTGERAFRFRTRVRTNAPAPRFRRRLEVLGLLQHAAAIEPITTNWFWTGSGQGYEILWHDNTTVDDLLTLARL